MGIKLTKSGGYDARTTAGREAIARAERVAQVQAHARAQAYLERERFEMENDEIALKNKAIKKIEAFKPSDDKDMLLSTMGHFKERTWDFYLDENRFDLFEKDCQIARAILQKYKEFIMWVEIKYPQDQDFQTFLSSFDYDEARSKLEKRIIKITIHFLKKKCEEVDLSKDHGESDSLKRNAKEAKEYLKNYKEFLEKSKMQYPNDQEFQAFLIESEKFIAPFAKKVKITYYWHIILFLFVFGGIAAFFGFVFLLVALFGHN